MAKIREYVKLVDEYLNDLRTVLRNVESQEEFSSNPQTYYSALHLLQLCIKCLIDMSSRLISLLGLRKPREYSEIAEILFKERILGNDEWRSLREMIKFRNLLIHVYAKVSPDIVYRIAKERAERNIKSIAGKILKAAIDRGYDP
jgi:uncharacterized protein YutE (UPF0331/DUF86 family)